MNDYSETEDGDICEYRCLYLIIPLIPILYLLYERLSNRNTNCWVIVRICSSSNKDAFVSDYRQRATIRAAFQHWADNTCIRFRELSVNARFDGNYILLTNQKKKRFVNRNLSQYY